MGKTVKCAYKTCLHDSQELDECDAVKVGSKYYHKDCNQTKEDIKEIVDLFTKHINPYPVFSMLQSVIKTIVFKKSVSSSYLLFGLKYYIEHKIPLNYPQGLYYVIQSKEVKDAYDKKKLSEYRKIEVNVEDSNDTSFGFRPTKQKGFDDILKES